jgi:hypothetical protein
MLELIRGQNSAIAVSCCMSLPTEDGVNDVQSGLCFTLLRCSTPVSCLLSPVSCFLFPVSCFLFPVVVLLFLVVLRSNAMFFRSLFYLVASIIGCIYLDFLQDYIFKYSIRRLFSTFCASNPSLWTLLISRTQVRL